MTQRRMKRTYSEEQKKQLVEMSSFPALGSSTGPTIGQSMPESSSSIRGFGVG